jgi:hypothetical protein
MPPRPISFVMRNFPSNTVPIGTWDFWGVEAILVRRRSGGAEALDAATLARVPDDREKPRAKSREEL